MSFPFQFLVTISILLFPESSVYSFFVKFSLTISFFFDLKMVKRISFLGMSASRFIPRIRDIGFEEARMVIYVRRFEDLQVIYLRSLLGKVVKKRFRICCEIRLVDFGHERMMVLLVVKSESSVLLYVGKRSFEV
ncbi:unnamed protein product [Lathyrus oleraceus]